MADWLAQITEISAGWKWLILAILLGIGELAVPGVFLIWIALGAAVVGFATLATGIGAAFQFALFAAMALVTVHLGRRWYANSNVVNQDPLLNDRSGRLVGQTATVIEPLSSTGGRAKVGDSVWPARGPGMEPGTKARIAFVESGVVHLEAYEE